jgi:two-component system sensor histidine kinase AgrC
MWVMMCYAAVYFLEACILWQYCRNLFPSKCPRQVEAFFLFTGYSILFAGSFFDNYWLNLALFFLVNLSCIFIMYQPKLLTALFHDLFITISMLLSELCISGVFFYFGSDFYGQEAYFRNLVIFSVISKLLYFLILQCTSIYIKQRITRELFFSKSTLFLNIIPLLSAFIALVLIAVCTKVTLPLILDILISISAILLLAINIFLAWFHTSTQEKNQQFLEMQLLLQKEYDTALYFDALYQQDEKQKILIHDIRKHLLSIADLNEKGDTEKIAAYIYQIIQSSDLQYSVRICDNNLLNTILFRSKQQCKASGTSFLTDIRSGCTDFLSEYDLTSLFSNLLDNAIDATKNISDSYIELNVTPHSDKKIIITMVNSCRKNPFSKNSKRLTTTKKNKLRHGYGMKSIQRVVDKYEGDYRFYFDEENYTFHTILVLKRISPGDN